MPTPSHAQPGLVPALPLPPTPTQNLPPTPASSALGGGFFPFFKAAAPRELSGDSVSTMATLFDEEEKATGPEAALLQKIAAQGSISELDLLAAVRRYPDVASWVLPGVDAKHLATDEGAFEAVDDLFENIGGGRKRISHGEFLAYFRRGAAGRTPNGAAGELWRVYSLMDADHNGSVSQLQFFGALERCPEVVRFVLPYTPLHGKILNDEEAFDVAKRVFDGISGGKKRFTFADFEKYYRQVLAPTCSLPSKALPDRATKRIFIIGPGFGRQLNPRQGALVEQAGYKAVHWCADNLPNPEQPNFDVRPFLETIRRALEHFQPHVVACASKGGAYILGLWASGLWRGPTLLINAHPNCQRLPDNVPIVLCSGSNDEVYPTARSKLEEVMATGNANKCFLYHTANSGQLPSGQLSRVGDYHNMESLLSHDCLPRLLDAAMSPEGPESYFIRTWRDRLTDERLKSEQWLGYCPEHFRKRWASPTHRGPDGKKLFEVKFGSEEHYHISAVFKAQPLEPPAYLLSPPATWDAVQIRRIERIENSTVLDGCSRPYFASIETSVNAQGLRFEPGVHTCWAFHGTDAAAIDSIVHNPVCSFQPLASGTRGSALWGSGTYFARDAKYVADGGFCGQPAADGTRTMLMCLLATGMPCLGDPNHRGVLPIRRRPHRYHSSVDCLANPEVFITQHSGAAHAAYLITFA